MKRGLNGGDSLDFKMKWIRLLATTTSPSLILLFQPLSFLLFSFVNTETILMLSASFFIHHFPPNNKTLLSVSI